MTGATHRQVRAERVTKSMRSTRWNAGLAPCFPNGFAADVLRERRAIIQTEHARALQVTMVACAPAARTRARAHREGVEATISRRRPASGLGRFSIEPIHRLLQPASGARRRFVETPKCVYRPALAVLWGSPLAHRAESRPIPMRLRRNDSVYSAGACALFARPARSKTARSRGRVSRAS
jgi:hypothetical protein